MFRIFAGENCIHDDATPLKEYKVFNSELKLADNAAGSLEFSMAYTHAFYGADPVTNEQYIKRMTTPITVYKQDEIFWEGRILSESFDFYNTRKIYCEGALAFLNDTCQPQKKYSGISATMFFKQVIANHNAKSTDGHKFDTEHGAVIQFGDVQIEDRVTQFESTYETIRKLIDDYGGHVRIRYYGGYRLIEWLKDYPETSTQTIEFGENLLDFSKSYDMSSLCTVVLPVGKKIADKGKAVPGNTINPTSTSYAYIPNADQPGTALTISGTSGSSVVRANGQYEYISSGLDSKHKTAIINLSNVGIAPGSIIYYTGAQTPVTSGSSNYAAALWIFKDNANISLGNYIQTNLKMTTTTARTIATADTQKITVPAGAKLLIIGWNSDACTTTGLTLTVNKNNPANSVVQDPNHYLKEYDLPANKTVYITTTQDSGYCMYAFKNNNGDYFQTPRKFASSNGVTTITESKQQGADNATKLVVGGRVDAPDFRVNAVSEANADYDLYVTVEDAKTNTDHSMYVKNDIKDESDPNSKSALDTYGWIEKKFEWPDDEDPNVLYQHAMEYLTNGQFDKLSIELTAVDLQLFGADVEALHVLDQVRVISRPHGMDKIMPITEITIPLDKPETTRYTIGYEEDKSLTNKMAESNANVMVTMNATVNNTKMLDQAKAEAASIIGGATHGYVTMVPDATTGAWKELVISNVPDYTQADKLWRWNLNGLGYFETAGNVKPYEQPWASKVGAAITYDGKIVADLITAGTMKADRVTGGDLKGVKITTGGTLIDGQPRHGKLIVKNENEEDIVWLDQNGLTIDNGAALTANKKWIIERQGNIFFGRETEPSQFNYTCLINGRKQANIGGSTYYGVSIEATQAPGSDGHGGWGPTSKGVILLCTDKLCVTDSANPNSIGGIGIGGPTPVTHDVVSNVEIGTDPDTSELALKLTIDTFTFMHGIVTNVTTRTVWRDFPSS
jgi:hypothetical protein